MARQSQDPYDLIVIGGGVAGIIVAAKIAETGIHPRTGGKLRIAMIERGPYLKGQPRPGYGHPARRQMFTNILSEFRERGRYRMQFFPEGPGGPNTFPIPAGSLVGGGSLHYGANTRHPHPIDYQAWQDETGVDWSLDQMAPVAREIVERFNIHERPAELLTRFDLDFARAGKDLGLEVSPTTVAKQNCLLSGFCDSLNMCKYDARGGSFVAYIPVAEANGVEIIPDAEVRQVNIQGSRASGVTLLQNGIEHLLKADKVVVSCGIMGSPLLLMRSGYGSARDLGGIPLVENDNVGRNIDGRAGPLNVNAFFDTPMADGRFHDGGFHLFQDTQPEGIYDRIQLRSFYPRIGEPHQLALHERAPEFGRPHREFMREICDPAIPSPQREEILKRGRVTVVVVRPSRVLGRIDMRAGLHYQIDHPSIKRLLDQGYQLAGEVLRSMRATSVVRDSHPIRLPSFFAWAGSCRAGTDRRDSVVNPAGECHDIENLFVCDASILPRCASQGYAGPTATVAAFIAQRMVESHFS